MIALLQLALAARDARTPDRRRAALADLIGACESQLAALDAPAHAAAEAAVVVGDAGPMAESAPAFWQRHADECGEALLVLERMQTLHGVTPCLTYARRESDATPWERDNFRWRVEPTAAQAAVEGEP
jgi:hypothetical protein